MCQLRPLGTVQPKVQTPCYRQSKIIPQPYPYDLFSCDLIRNKTESTSTKESSTINELFLVCYYSQAYYNTKSVLLLQINNSVFFEKSSQGLALATVGFSLTCIFIHDRLYNRYNVLNVEVI